MDDEPEGRRRPARPRARKPTFAERRERRAAVEDVAEVLDAAARFLEARPRSVAEVERKLGGMGYQPSLVAEVVERLVQLGYLDDEAFARAWVESRDRASPRGEHALRRELSQRGVDRTLVDEVLAARRDRPASAQASQTPDEAAAERLLTQAPARPPARGRPSPAAAEGVRAACPIRLSAGRLRIGDPDGPRGGRRG